MLATGYRGDEGRRRSRAGADWPAGRDVECVDTGLDTPTGGRMHARAPSRSDASWSTYADGVADLDVGALRAVHAAHDSLATVTVVRPRLPFGVADARRRWTA